MWVKYLTIHSLNRDGRLHFPGAFSDSTSLALVFQTAVGCRVAMVMMQYSILANSYWLLVEGIYLHSLLVVTVLTERNYFGVYLCIGWGESFGFHSLYALNTLTRITSFVQTERDRWPTLHITSSPFLFLSHRCTLDIRVAVGYREVLVRE